VQIFGVEDMGKLMRVHLARLLPHSMIKIHMDHGGYTAKVGPLQPSEGLLLLRPNQDGPLSGMGMPQQPDVQMVFTT
jgi:hypothetical protein